MCARYNADEWKNNLKPGQSCKENDLMLIDEI